MANKRSNWMGRLLYVFQFCSRIPINRAIDLTEEDPARATGLFPLVGVAAGAAGAAGFFIGERIGGVFVGGALAVLFELMLTGGLHLDGLGDVCDGIFSGRSRERMLEIMKDSNSGSFGVAGIAMDLLLKTVLFAQLGMGGIVVSAILSRVALTSTAASSEYARQNGMGKHFIDNVGLRDVLLALAFGLLSFLFLPGWQTAIAILCAPFFGFLLAKYFEKKLGGITGDCLGASEEVSQILLMILLVALGGG